MRLHRKLRTIIFLTGCLKMQRLPDTGRNCLNNTVPVRAFIRHWPLPEQELLRELEDKLQKSLGTKRVRLAVEVIPEEKIEKKIYMPEDKAKAMMAGNEEIRNLVKDLDLDVK